jgi:hypothetical protein
MTFQFAAILSPIHDKTNIFKNEKNLQFSSCCRMCIEGGRGIDLLPNVKAESSPEPGYEPEHCIYFGQKGLVPTFAVHLLEQEKNHQ